MAIGITVLSNLAARSPSSPSNSFGVQMTPCIQEIFSMQGEILEVVSPTSQRRPKHIVDSEVTLLSLCSSHCARSTLEHR